MFVKKLLSIEKLMLTPKQIFILLLIVLLHQPDTETSLRTSDGAAVKDDIATEVKIIAIGSEDDHLGATRRRSGLAERRVLVLRRTQIMSRKIQF
jgi:hypothetical protein